MRLGGHRREGECDASGCQVVTAHRTCLTRRGLRHPVQPYIDAYRIKSNTDEKTTR